MLKRCYIRVIYVTLTYALVNFGVIVRYVIYVSELWLGRVSYLYLCRVNYLGIVDVRT